VSETKPNTHPQMLWSGWGDPAQAVTLTEPMLELLRTALGLGEPTPPVAGVEQVQLPDCRLQEEALAALAGIVGAGNLDTSPAARVRHTRGKSTPDLLRIRAGEAHDAPDAVLSPATHEEVLAVLACCSQRRLAVVPFGGGTSVVGGLQPRREGLDGVVCVDLGRMAALLDLDEESRTATMQPGLRGPEAEALLAARGYTIGHHPQSYMFASLGGFAAARSSGQASAGYGRFDENVVALTVATPQGTISLGRAPRSAAGPDLRQLFLGSEGSLGVITSLTVQLRRAPALSVYEGWRLPSFAAGAAVVRRLVQDGPVPTVLRLSDETETALNLARPTELSAEGDGGGEARGAGRTAAQDPPAGACLAIVGVEGDAGDVDARREGVARVLDAAGATPDPEAGEAWAQGRYHGPYLRDALLDQGALVETLETAAFWSAVPDLYTAVGDAVRAALQDEGSPGIVMCHISHVYPSGASLYFTVACAGGADPLQRWARVKAAASEAILAAGGSITHHHGIGRDHLPWYERQMGPIAMGALRALKAELDPAGIMNPGILIS
jgi:alkyldihydroxyacetonephosphate synthase